MVTGYNKIKTSCFIGLQVVHEKLVKMSDGGATTGSFSVDPSLGHNTKFGVYVEVCFVCFLLINLFTFN